jgi:hypothetical protein
MLRRHEIKYRGTSLSNWLTLIGLILCLIGAVILFVPIGFMNKTNITDAFGKEMFVSDSFKPSCPQFLRNWYFDYALYAYISILFGTILQIIAVGIVLWKAS